MYKPILGFCRESEKSEKNPNSFGRQRKNGTKIARPRAELHPPKGLCRRVGDEGTKLIGGGPRCVFEIMVFQLIGHFLVAH